ncbi:HEAT repeat domain-containing protein [Kribbella sp. NPDC059898]|uniref:HEAT repeat domain-containing protein n=1 Tax=Kribbella sp. NPDC059898 TaxID=3346995 RepID=UPI00366008C6
MTKRFERALGLMRRRDPEVQESGFQLLLPHAAEHVHELMTAFRLEQADQGLRRWLLELVGEARSQEALPLLVEQLQSDDELLRGWAVRGLQMLDSKSAREQLWRARANGLID